jgi:hypothetical protein
MYRKYINFIRGISVNRTGRLGVILTTSAFVSFLVFEFLRLLGVLTNAYLGLVTYLLFPALFLLGLLLIPIGWYKYRKERKMTTRELLNERFESADVQARGIGSKVFLTILAFTVANVVFITGAGFRTLKFMDQSEFCGTACHKVMSPEWTTYQLSPHARVKCVECHVGEGMTALINSKLSGLRQMIKATFNTYERPIPTPVHQLRPARETCEKCHWPEKFYGQRMKTIARFDSDKTSTRRYTTLNLKIDTGKSATKSGIHWHIAKENEVRYASIGDQRIDMLWVEVRQEDGSFKRYINQKYAHLANDDSKEKEWNHVRTMDCVDCHNRATHIYEDPSHAIDDRMDKKMVNRDLPYAKREILAAISINYSDREAAMKGITYHLQGFYRRNYPNIAGQHMKKIDQMVTVAKEIYNRNIHQIMKIEWGTYPNFIGHNHGDGCFRCHNENLRDNLGNILPYDCTLCHSIISYGEETPFQYLEEPNKKSPNYKMHKMLRDEFFKQKE